MCQQTPLIYSERFVTPIILAVCPINNEKHVFYYVWLQDYIKSVLNFDNQNWRKNKSTTRIFIPENNLMPDKKEHLTFISHFPQRLYGACGVARILHDLQRGRLGMLFMPNINMRKMSGNEKMLPDLPG